LYREIFGGVEIEQALLNFSISEMGIVEFQRLELSLDGAC